MDHNPADVHDVTVETVLATVGDTDTVRDCRKLIDLMHTITGVQPQVWNDRIIGFGTYHYRYDSGREGDCHVLGFAARSRKITLYLMDGTSRHAAQLGQLGRHTTGRACLYVKQLDDIDLEVLEAVLRDSYAYVSALDGSMHRAM